MPDPGYYPPCQKAEAVAATRDVLGTAFPIDLTVPADMMATLERIPGEPAPRNIVKEDP